MSTYFICYRYTDEGIRAPGASGKRLPLLKQRIADMGGELKVSISPWGCLTRSRSQPFFALASSSNGYVTITTMKAFTAEEYLDIISDLSGSQD